MHKYLIIMLSLLSWHSIKSDAVITVPGGTIDIFYTVDSSWESGFQATLLIKNNTLQSIENWNFSFTLPHQISSYWQAVLLNHQQNTYTFAGPSWQKNIEPGMAAEIGFVAQLNGPYTEPTNFTINGQNGGNNGGNSGGGGDNTQPAGAPAKPTVSIEKNWSDNSGGSYTVSWHIYYGNKATRWQLFENNQLIYSANIASTTIESSQGADYQISNRTFGIFEYKVVVTNDKGSTSSDSVVYTAGDASKITINPVDANGQQLQWTIDQGTTNFTLDVIGTTNPTFSVKTNNASVIQPTINGKTLTINALQTGRAGLAISSGDQTRYLGIRVKTADGKIPCLPSYLAIGSVSEDTQPHLTFLRSFDAGLRNKWVDIRYIYINGGPFNGWRTWSNADGGRAISYINESKKLGIIPFFVYYNIPDAGESYYTDKQHIEDQTYMEAYYKDLKFFLDIIKNYGGDETVGIVLEPDFIGYMMQNSNGNHPTPANQLVARTNAAYTSGVLNATTDPVFENNIQGLIKSINYMISKFAPNAIFGWQFNLWASPGITTSIPGNGLMHKTDTAGITEGRKAIASEAAVIAQYYKDAGITSYGAQFVSIDKYGLDAGISSPQNPAQSIWFWNADHWNNYLLFAHTLHDAVQLPVILWQLPVGHINTSLQTNPYDANKPFPLLQNTSQHYEDSSPIFFLGDSFKPGTQTRFDYFKTNAGADAKITAVGDTVTWKSHMLDAKKAGIIAMLFGAGVGDSTQNIGTPPTDSYWWITKTQSYFKNPVALN